MMENPCMVIGGIVQPAIFEGIKGVLNTEERGFIQRLIVYAPQDRLGERAFAHNQYPIGSATPTTGWCLISYAGCGMCRAVAA
jgi:hypothetical protein